ADPPGGSAAPTRARGRSGAWTTLYGQYGGTQPPRVCKEVAVARECRGAGTMVAMTHPVRSTFPLGTPWPTIDPFLFVAHHRDAYPAGNGRLGPDASLAGRELGRDFAGRDGWNMY